MAYQQIRNTGNEDYRDLWIKNTITKLSSDSSGSIVLDVGAGLSPYRGIAEKLGWNYLSHDFSAYIPSEESQGLQNESWDYVEHDYVCDILEIPLSINPKLVLCTEVFEHIPDPVRAFQRISLLLEKDGYILITVPFMSLMHQAPFWFQSGLSPFWFEYWAKENNLKVTELTVYGDYVDLMSQEINRLLGSFLKIRGLGRVISWIVRRFRRILKQEILSSGGFGVAFLGQKI